MSVPLDWDEGVKWNRPTTSLGGQLKIEGIQLLRVPLSNVYNQHQSPSCILIFSLLLICCGCLLFILHQPEPCGDDGPVQQNFTVILVLSSWSHTFPSPFSGASIFSKQLSLQPMPRPNHNQPIAGQVCVWIWAALLNSDVCQYPSFILFLFVSPPGKYNSFCQCSQQASIFTHRRYQNTTLSSPKPNKSQQHLPL